MEKRFTNVIRTEDIIVHINNEEFIILLSDIGKPKFASTVAKKILQICSAPIKINSSQLILTASIGICIYPNDGDSLEKLLDNADVALTQARQKNDNAYQFYTREMDIEAREYMQLGSALRQAVENGEFTLNYQPKIHIKNGNLIGVESLIRWTHPELGIINPIVFIQLAEEIGIVMQIGEWTLREACRANKHWQDEGYEHITVSVNLSLKQFHHPELVNTIEKILKDTKLNPEYLELEVSEKIAMENIETSIKIMNGLKDIGVQISLDHFGTRKHLYNQSQTISN